MWARVRTTLVLSRTLKISGWYVVRGRGMKDKHWKPPGNGSKKAREMACQPYRRSKAQSKLCTRCATSQPTGRVAPLLGLCVWVTKNWSVIAQKRKLMRLNEWFWQCAAPQCAAAAPHTYTWSSALLHYGHHLPPLVLSILYEVTVDKVYIYVV